MEESGGRWQRPHSSGSMEGPVRPGSGDRAAREGRRDLNRRLETAGGPGWPGSGGWESQGVGMAWIRRRDVAGCRRGLDPVLARAGTWTGEGWLAGEERKPVGRGAGGNRWDVVGGGRGCQPWGGVDEGAPAIRGGWGAPAVAGGWGALAGEGSGLGGGVEGTGGGVGSGGEEGESAGE
nr:spidroin-1-like [Aegilops tauschii subsp. strangulata]